MPRKAAESVGEPFAIAEMGSVLAAGDDGSARADWLRAMGTYLKKHRAEFVAYFDFLWSDGGYDYRLRDQPSMRAWAEISDAVTCCRLGRPPREHRGNCEASCAGWPPNVSGGKLEPAARGGVEAGAVGSELRRRLRKRPVASGRVPVAVVVRDGADAISVFRRPTPRAGPPLGTGR